MTTRVVTSKCGVKGPQAQELDPLMWASIVGYP
jgi:hypothetical protein